MRSDKVSMSLTGSLALALQKAEASSLQGGKPCRFRSRLNRVTTVEPPRRVPEPHGFWLCDWYRQEFLWAAESSSASLLAFDFFQEKPECGKGAVFRQPKIVSRGFCLKSTPFEVGSAGTQPARDIAVGVRRRVSLADGRPCLSPAF